MLCALACALALASCDRQRAAPPPAPSAPPTSPAAPAADQGAPAPAPDLAPSPDLGPGPPPDPLAGLEAPSHAPLALERDEIVDAPAALEGVVPRVVPGRATRFGDLIHEGNNITMRGPRGPGGLYRDDSAEVAQRWRRYAAGTRGVFVLRDSLFSQQDHPYRQAPVAALLPPSWVAVAADLTGCGELIEGPLDAPVTDEEAWQGRSLEEVFGSFPPSSSLHEHATARWARAARPEAARRMAYNARRTLRALAADVDAMRAATAWGAQAVIDAGAARIAASDRRYFGPKVRREHIIPIFVENPDAKERREGKGSAPGDRELDEALVRRVTHTIYRRRLIDGDLAVERYDLSRPAQRARAVALLEALLPPEEAGPGQARVWLWVTGRLDPERKLRGEGPLRYLPELRREIEAADIDTSRLELFGKPTVVIPTRGPAAERRAALERAVREHERAGMRHVSVNLGAPALWNIVSP